MEEKIYFKNPSGNKLSGILSNPTGNKEKPIIILCHGFSTSKDNFTNTNLVKIFNGKGIATFRFDFYGHGESEGKFENITVSEGAEDILSAIKFLKGTGYGKIGLFGSSYGGIASITAASKTKDIFVLALKSPVSDYEEVEILSKGKSGIAEWKRKGYDFYVSGDGRKLKLNYAFFEDFKNNNGYEAAKYITVPTLIVHGDKDESVPVEQSKKLVKILKKGKLEIIKDADHRYSKSGDFKKMINLIVEFIVKNS